MRIVNPEKRPYVRDLHSCAQDIGYAASSLRHDDFYRETCQEIAKLVASIPDNEKSARRNLEPIVELLLASQTKAANETESDLENLRRQLASRFARELDMMYPEHLEVEQGQIIQRSFY